MRFDDWDVLLFPRDCKVPVKEFKVACHVIHDAVSIHSWSSPTLSQFTRCYSKYGDDANFEARVFIDGQLVASAPLDREKDWPHIIIHSFGVAKNGDLEPLKFPGFRQELLRQNHWHPADNFGRIKIVISEGFPRDSLSLPMQRVKNVVAFSFQHAPLEILENSCIAWPNPSMWRRIPAPAARAVQAYPSDDIDSHAHSPRRKYTRINANPVSSLTESLRGTMDNRNTRQSQGTSGYQSGSTRAASGSTSTGTLETINDSNAYFEWLNGMGTGVNDTHQLFEHDLFAPGQNGRRLPSGGVPPYMSLGNSMGPYLDQSLGLQNFRNEDGRDQFDYIRSAAEVSDVEAVCGQETQDLFVPRLSQDNMFTMDTPTSLAHSLLNQPMPAHLLGVSVQTVQPEVRPHQADDLHQAPDPSPSSASTSSTSHNNHAGVRRTVRRPSKAHNVSGQPGSSSSGYRSSLPDANQHLASVEDYVSVLEGRLIEDAAASNAAPPSTDKGTKRSHDSASGPGSAVMSDEDQRRPSPRAHITALLAQSPTFNGQ
ncbi:hypothetical protein BBK36DRAFT_1168406 [Trichoderma citrinoviride]|uniref:Uncharacterized protein n=1 Tax=Trichoderma citrinoviride TaxID=58853 RepID=A0A2T4BC83_9HYPO|nr:hypothetical protein BBK36DRAFT_1168406 [Trichoderma citrinoviride]PTB66888.1 hypothetical protein BBK36DRAFT_1168406 [Trichoderma citrinoviride]